MAYKKYIKRGDKIYGPYTYESKRVDGVVVSQYHGKTKKEKDNLLIAVSIFFVAVSIFLVSMFGGLPLTGGVALQVVTEDVTENSTFLDGEVMLSLQEGELLPADTVVFMELNDQNYTYQLSELVSADLVDGEFFVQGRNLNGSGYGYGIVGINEIYPEVTFQLEVISENVDDESEDGSDEEQDSGEDEESSEEESDTDVDSNETQSEEDGEEQSDSEEQSDEESDSGEDEEVEEDGSGEEEQEEDSGEDDTGDEESSEEESDEEEQDSEEDEESDEGSDDGGITGEVVRGIVGLVSANIITYVEGSVSAGDPYNLVLSQSQSISLVSGSVEVDGVSFSDDLINIEIDGNQVVITTDFVQSEEGFGSEYRGEDSFDLDINLQEAGLPAEDGELTVTLIYDDEEIVSASSSLFGFVDTAPDEEEIIELETFENVTKIDSIDLYTDEIFEGLELSEEEVLLLEEKTGSGILETTKAELEYGRLVVRYELGKYWVEFTYDYDMNAGIDELEDKIEFERLQWLKFLAKQLDVSGTGEDKLEFEDLLKNHNLNETGVPELENNITDKNDSVVVDEINEDTNESVEEVVDNVPDGVPDDVPELEANSSDQLANVSQSEENVTA